MSHIKPHGGQLINRFEPDRGTEHLDKEIPLDGMALSDLELIANGAYSPLTGFMGQQDYERVLTEMRLANGLVWSLPITLPVEEERAASIREGDEVKLVYQGEVYGVIQVEEKYRPDKRREAELVFLTTDEAHPGVKKLYERPPVYVAGPVYLVKRPPKRAFAQYYLDPAETRAQFAERGWRRVVGFQTRNPVHRAHEYIQKAAMEIVDGLFLIPWWGKPRRTIFPPMCA